MASGVKIDDEVKATYQQIALTSSKTTKLRYAVFKFSDDLKKIVVEKKATAEEAEAQNTHYDALIESLPSDDVRYVAYEFPYYNKDDTFKSDMILISWSPVNCTVKKKMICASSLNALKSALSVNKNVIEGDSLQEVDSAAALLKVGGKSKA